MSYVLKEDLSQDSLTSGVIKWCEHDEMLIQSSTGLIKAKRAAGCLLDPEVGDTVLIACLNYSENWVLNVLKRQNKDAKLILPDKTEINSMDLKINTQKASLQVADLEMSGHSLSMNYNIIKTVTHALLQTFDIAHSLGQKLVETIAKQIGFYGARKSTVCALDEQNAGRIRIETSSGYRLRSENTDIKSREVIDLDAKHIKIG